MIGNLIVSEMIEQHTWVCACFNLSLRENYDSVEHVENLQSWLVDGEHYSSIGGCQSIQMNQ